MLRAVWLLAALARSTLGLAEILPPGARALPTQVGAAWNDLRLDTLLPLEVDGVEIVAETSFALERARVDIFERSGGEWKWSDTRRIDGNKRYLREASHRRGVLVRSADRSGIYGWGECAVGRGACRIDWYRSIRVQSDVARPLIIVAVEDEPHVADVGDSSGQFRFVRALPGVVCAVSTSHEGQCKEISSEATTLSFSTGESRPLRMVQLTTSCLGLELVVRSPGRATTRPREIAAQMSCGGRWLGMELETINESVMIDILAPDRAVQRVAAASLPPPPNWRTLDMVVERGITVMPLLTTRDVPPEPGARLLFLGAESESSARVPLHVAEIDSSGVAYVPNLGSGSYRLKLFSKLSDRRLVEVQLFAGTPEAIRFGAGIRIKGRIRQTGSSRAFVTVQRDIALDEMHDVDLAEAVVSAEADAGGEFEVAVSASGKYSAVITREPQRTARVFEVPESASELDLGEIVFSAGGSVRGRVDGCADGGLRWVKQPDAKRIEPPQFLVARGSERGDYLVEGLDEGQWFVMASCNGTLRPVVPPSVTLPPGGVLVVDFRVE